jgi:Glycosyl hydrolases family 16
VGRHLPVRLLVLALAVGALATGAASALAATHHRPTRTVRTRAARRTRARHSARRKPQRRVKHKTRRKPTTRATMATAPVSTAPSAAASPAATSGSGAVLGGGPGPSGVPMPVGDLPGWHQVLADDFTESQLNPDVWTRYWGQPGGDPGGWFDPSHVSLSNGDLVINAYQDPADGGKWATGGVSSAPGLSQTYGKYEVRFRFDSGVGIAHAILLWPTDNTWPPEIDFSEDNGSDRQTDYATLHYGADNSMVSRQLAVNLTQWHTLGVEWTPGNLVYTIDGQPWASVSSSQVPSTPMALDIQTQAWACGTSTWEQCPTASTPSHVNLYVDWVVAYARD